MAAQGHVEDAFTFVGGLNTEGSFFLTPKNCWKEGDNVVPQTDGTLERRKGLGYETGYSNQTVNSSLTNTAYTVHKWTAVGGNGNVDFIVVQLGYHLYFYNALGGTVSQRYIGTVNFQSFQAYGNTDNVETLPVQVATSLGDLVVTHQSCDPFVVRYDGSSLTTDRITLKIRDFTGVYMGTTITDEKTEAEWEALGLKAAALYNLYNQGWTSTQINAYKTANAGKLPNNTKSWIYGKDSNDVFDASVLNKQDFGTSPAPRGRVIFDAFNQVRSVSDLSITSSVAASPNWQDNRIYTGNAVGASALDIYTNYVSQRPRACGFFAGRVWYAGVPNEVQNGWIYFSQVATDKDKYSKCYQENDPASEVLSDILDDDGGIIVIPEIGEIVALRGTSNALVIFASNGIWSVVGGDNGFKATQYTVSKISSTGCINAESIVEIEDAFMFWSLTGIYALKLGQLGEGAVQNASDTNIKAFYDDIPAICRLNVQGEYDYVKKRVEYVYSDDPTKPALKNRSLCFDVRMQAWYTYTFTNTVSSPQIVGIVTTTQAADTEQTFDVVVGSDDVEVLGDQVTVDLTITTGSDSVVKYVVLSSDAVSLTFADLLQTSFSDWGTEQPAYVITGYTMGNNGPARAKTAGYMSVFMKRTETAIDALGEPVNPSGITLQTRWDFTDNTYPGKWSGEVQVYRQLRPFLTSFPATFDDGYPLVITKNKIRGRGKALQMKLQAEAGKDMKLVGWSMTFIGNTNV